MTAPDKAIETDAGIELKQATVGQLGLGAACFGIASLMVEEGVQRVLGFDPIQLMFWANVLQGVLSPTLIVLLVLLGNKRAVMKGYRFGTRLNVTLILMALIMFTATALLVYGLLTGQTN